MNNNSIPKRFQKQINGVNYYMLADVMGWLKGSDNPVQVNVYKRRCSQANLISHKDSTQKGKPRIYVNINGLKEIVERTQTVKLDYKRLLGVGSGTTRNEYVFFNLLDGFFTEAGIEVKNQVGHGEYFIDFVVGGVIAVEYDEVGHSSYDRSKDKEREAFIEESYKLIRISDKMNEGEALAIINKAMIFIRKQKDQTQ